MNDTYLIGKVLTPLADKHKAADIITRNGYHICGNVIEFDSQSMLMEVDGERQLVLLQNVSTIVPFK